MLDFGACKTGDDCAKHTVPVDSTRTIVFQSLYFPISFKSSALNGDKTHKKIIKKQIEYFLIMDKDLGKFFELH